MRFSAIAAALSISLLVTGALRAQTPEVQHIPPQFPDLTEPAPGPQLPLSELEPRQPERAEPQRSIEVLGSGTRSPRIATNALVTGDPHYSVKLGTFDGTSAFTVLNGATTPVGLFKVFGNGWVGIGTEAPAQFVEIQRNLAGGTLLQISNSDSGAGSFSYSGLRLSEGATSKFQLVTFNSASSITPNGVQVTNLANGVMTFGTNNTERMRINADGSVVFGTTVAAPGARQYVLDHVFLNSGVNDSGVRRSAIFQAGVQGTGTLATTVGQTVYSGVMAGHSGTVTNAYGLQVYVDAASGQIGSGYGLWLSDVNATNAYSIYQVGSDDVNYLGGRVRIGTTTAAPNSSAAKLQIHDTVAAPRAIFTGAEFYQSAYTSTDGVGLYLGVNRTNNRQLWVGDSHSSATAPFVRFISYQGVATIDAISRDGNTPQPLNLSGYGSGVVIGSMTGASLGNNKLYVAGDAHFTGTVTGGTINATYQDVAEWVPATTDLAAGTVVVLNTARNNEVMASSSPYDTSVAGVVSAQPGLSLGIAGEGKEQIATTGRVKVRVDARNAPIRVGDLLVTSSVPGTAMRSEPMNINGRNFHQPGTIIGKALEPLASGTGEILVLLSMQ